MASNRGVAYIKPGVVEVQSIPYPKLRMPKSETDPFGGKDAPHGVILKIVTTNICGSDQHMVRGRTTAPQGLILGHEITGEIIEKGSDVEMLNDRRPGDRAVQHRLRALPQLPRRQDRHLPHRESGSSGRGLRLCGHGRMGRRPGGIRDGALRRFQPDQVPQQGKGDGEDQGSHAAVRHLPHRLSRLQSRRALDQAPRSTSRARARWAWRAAAGASCWARRW